MPGTQFHKYEGLGNDFIVVDGASIGLGERAVALCDRHFGIGADGVLAVTAGSTPGARATMTVHNADGSRPEMCGNGLRCVALHLARLDGAENAEYVVDTDAGAKKCVVSRTNGTAQVMIDMGRAVAQGEYRTEQDGKEYLFARVSMGNPHAVWLGGILDGADADRVGSSVSSQIPGGTNVEFVAQRGPQAADLVVWERGVGRTLACGTGAGATAAALALAGKAPFGQAIEIRLPGGPLDVWVDEKTLAVRLRGPARWVFTGNLPPA
ncbi:MAG TPA: diaminopimelate epimerase [Polyangiaceae bacterium]|jgi:diaminopimelate epimerase|nr:diaminopimelate epimerase [Polyangiaceae bacterium]